MPRRATSRLVPYEPQKMYDLVADIERYPEFIPWCRALRVISREPAGEDAEIVVADLLVGYRLFRETFRSRVLMDRAALKIDTDYVRGPMRSMQNIWRFEPAAYDLSEHGQPLDPAGHKEIPGCVVNFAVAFELRNPLLQTAANAVFEDAFGRMADAFIERAEDVYGAR